MPVLVPGVSSLLNTLSALNEQPSLLSSILRNEVGSPLEFPFEPRGSLTQKCTRISPKQRTFIQTMRGGVVPWLDVKMSAWPVFVLSTSSAENRDGGTLERMCASRLSSKNGSNTTASQSTLFPRTNYQNGKLSWNELTFHIDSAIVWIVACQGRLGINDERLQNSGDKFVRGPGYNRHEMTQRSHGIAHSKQN